ncbi:MAG: cyclic nucleotide-binding and patatin-like phospholipase domain-containing protein [Caldimonas sp.]
MTSSLALHPLFAGISATALAQLERHLQTRHFEAGDIILRAGVPSAELFGLIDGAVRVDLAGGGRRVLLVPPQCFGELSALTGDPVSATVVAQRDARAWVLSAPVLLEAMAQETAFFRNVATLLGLRLRERTRRAPASRPRVVLMPTPEEGDGVLLAALARGLQHYAPGSEHDDVSRDEIALGSLRIRRWRDEGAGDAVLLLGSGPAGCATLLAELDADDALLVTADDLLGLPDTLAAPVIWRRGALSEAAAMQRWCHALPRDEIEAAASGNDWSRARQPALDHLVRRLSGREVGLAMSVGAAAGLAHLGVLEVLEGDGLPIDFICGSSMGGAVALAYARCGSARAATEVILRLVADFARSKGMQWLPRASLVSASRMTTLTRQLYGDATFAQLRMPIAVVAADLAMGKRVVLDSGAVAPAARASAAIPGVFAPVRLGNAVLVDGGVVTRVPADLLTARGCGFKLAALVRPTYPESPTDAARAADRLEQRLHRPFGLRAAMGGAWRLMGWWDSANQAEHADLSLTVPIPVGEGFNFAAAEAMIDHGRHTAQQRLPQIRLAMQQVLAPGMP